MTWKNDLNYGLAAFGLKLPDNVPLDQLAARIGDNPCSNAATLVGVSSVLFYAAERGHNPKVNDIFDAMIYTSTCLSVGYGDIFAKTPFGKVLGTALMTIGPAVAAKTLDGPAADRRDMVQLEVLETLKQILTRLEPENSAKAAVAPAPDPPVAPLAPVAPDQK
jgi:hypothetical protein